jgi:hypothetical protein
VSGSAKWMAYASENLAPHVVLVMRSIVDDDFPPGSFERLRLVRDHQAFFEKALAEWSEERGVPVELELRDELALASIESKDLRKALALACDLMEQRPRDHGIDWRIGVAHDEVVNTAGYEPALPPGHRPNVTLTGAAVVSALALVRDFTRDGRVLVCGDLVDTIEGQEQQLEDETASTSISALKLQPVRPGVRLHRGASLKVGQIIWKDLDAASLTHRRSMLRELEALERHAGALRDVIVFHSTSFTGALAPPPATSKIAGQREMVEDKLKKEVDALNELWERIEECRADPQLPERVQAIAANYRTFHDQYRELVTGMRDDRLSTAEKERRAEDAITAWQRLRAEPGNVLDRINKVREKLIS